MKLHSGNYLLNTEWNAKVSESISVFRLETTDLLCDEKKSAFYPHDNFRQVFFIAV